MELLEILQTGGAVGATIGLLQVVKTMEIVPTKYIPAIGLIVGFGVCWIGSMAGVLPIIGLSNIIWHGIITGLMSCGLFSGAKNMFQQ